MKDIVLDNIINNIDKNYHYDKTKLLEIRYGLDSLFLSIFKILVVIVISIFIGTIKELLLLYVSYGLLRMTAFGAHAKRSIDCWIYSLLFFLLIPYLIKVSILSNKLIIILSIIYSIILIIYAPADTEKRPLIHKRKRIIYKVLTSIITLVFLSIIIISNNIYIKHLLHFSILLETILVLPITYKILGVKYKNYKRYKGKEDKK